MENNNQVQFQMRISSLEVLSFSKFEVKNINTSKDDIFIYHSDFGLIMFEESKEVGIELTVKMVVQETEEDFSDLKVRLKFAFDPFDKVVVRQKDNTFGLPNVVLSNLFHITAGTVRGILYEKLRGSLPQSIVLPLLNINQLFSQE